MKPFIPRNLQIFLRRFMVKFKRRYSSQVWPIDEEAGKLPESWRGWPDGKRFVLVLTHDVDTLRGQDRVQDLALLEQSMGFRSSFNFVIENNVSSELRRYLTTQGFEVGVHGLTHDGSLYKSREEFESQARVINKYLNEWASAGFRSPAMHHNLDWIHDLDIEYDASTFDTDPFEPQPDGMRTIFPFYVDNMDSGKGYVELPYTLAQDFTLFILMKERNIGVWKQKLDWIAAKGGMALLNTHPDYMNFAGNNLDCTEYPVALYVEFLNYVKSAYAGFFWNALPREVAAFWKNKFCHGIG